MEIFSSDMEKEVNSVSTIMSRNPHCSSEPRAKPTDLPQELCNLPMNSNCSSASCSNDE